MGEILNKRLKQKKFESTEQEALLNIFVASNHLKSKIEGASSTVGITSSQYNVLRILKGKYPDGYPRSEIIVRMIDPAPDVTRIIDRLIKQGLVERYTLNTDRRLSLTKITKEGLKALKKVKPRIDSQYLLISKKLNKTERKQLSNLLEKIYADLF